MVDVLETSVINLSELELGSSNVERPGESDPAAFSKKAVMSSWMVQHNNSNVPELDLETTEISTFTPEQGISVTPASGSMTPIGIGQGSGKLCNIEQLATPFAVPSPQSSSVNSVTSTTGAVVPSLVCAAEVGLAPTPVKAFAEDSNEVMSPTASSTAESPTANSKADGSTAVGEADEVTEVCAFEVPTSP
eukprot:TRINITY_DN9176_c0_g1_i1.p1 TRINITY_DN9176_c0_g1~~TRINITY_DN9176_c0_g1_i1.p1  ORF type:complete len:191 (+),score=47.08 TRINITY_DN9176_c0_g1_i1:233-805(+)